MKVRELIEELKKINNQDVDVVTIDSSGNVFKYDGFGIEKVVEVNCNQDKDMSAVYLISD